MIAPRVGFHAKTDSLLIVDDWQDWNMIITVGTSTIKTLEQEKEKRIPEINVVLLFEFLWRLSIFHNPR